MNDFERVVKTLQKNSEGFVKVDGPNNKIIIEHDFLTTTIHFSYKVKPEEIKKAYEEEVKKL